MRRRRLAFFTVAITVASCGGRTEPLRLGNGDGGVRDSGGPSDLGVSDGSDAGIFDSATLDIGGCNQPEEPVPLPLPPTGARAHLLRLRVTEGYIYMRPSNPKIGEEIIRFRPGSVAEHEIEFGGRLELLDVQGDRALYARDPGSPRPVEVTWHRGGSSVSVELNGTDNLERFFESAPGWQSHPSLMSETRVAWQSEGRETWTIDEPALRPVRLPRSTGLAPVVSERFTSYLSALRGNPSRIHVLDNPPNSARSQFDASRGNVTVALTDNALYFRNLIEVYVWRSPFDGAPTQIEIPSRERCDEIQSGGRSIYLVCEDVTEDRRTTIRRVVGDRTELVLQLDTQIRGTDFGERYASFIEVPFGFEIGRDSGQGSVVVVDLQTGRRTVVAPFEIVSDGLMDQPRLPGHTEVHDDIIVWYSTQSLAPAAGAVRMEKLCD